METKTNIQAVANRLATENERLKKLVAEYQQTVAMLAQQLADKREIIRRLTC